MELTRQTLIEIRQAAESCMHDDMNPTWLRAYQDLAQAACVVDAFTARAGGVETLVERST